ncbi:Peroxisomal membrane signal receptor PTS1 [Polyrhizophydium stewartii]|uniref:Peroxisomal membrane signal receptor PTS1 n=1 Tax=Polyrhizophydium stewartii TaxID=2732419 RepID=A0ABR4N013_9FUNG|nr:Peroxisomal membrane signal receptor PTS1 [Polyrhizophydium stewartii]
MSGGQGGPGGGGRGLLPALVGAGAECDTGNSLARLVKHGSQGTPLPDRTDAGPMGQAQASFRGAARTARFGAAGPADFGVEEFLGMHGGGAGSSAGPLHGPPGAFDMRQLRHELEHSVVPQQHLPGGGDAWADEFGAAAAGMRHMHPPGGAHDFAEFDEVFARVAGPHAGGPLAGDWAAEFGSATTDADFEKLFRESMTPEQREAFEHEWTKQFEAVRGSLMGKDPLGADGQLDPSRQSEWEAEFQRHLAKEMPGDEVDHAEWEEMFNNMWRADNSFGGLGAASGETLTDDWYQKFEDMLKRSAAEAEQNDLGMLNEMIDPDPVTSRLQPYVFESENPFLEHPDPLGVGIELRRRHASLSEAALAFEAAVQRDPSNSDAWMMLGQVQAENEKEGPAVAALQRSVQENPQNTEALMSLSVSYINEKMELHALTTLDRWFTTRYPDIAASVPPLPHKPTEPEYSISDLHARLVSMFLTAANEGMAASKGKGVMDPNVQVGLGLLYYREGDFAKSVDCFTAALSARPDDYQLWNRLGATLANSGRTEEAIETYYKALELNPSFVRVLYNLGIGCINIGCYREAAEHLLSGLSMHESNRFKQEKTSMNLWETLQRAFMLMDRPDLAAKTNTVRDVAAYRDEFTF